MEAGRERFKAFPTRDGAEAHLARLTAGVDTTPATRLLFGQYAQAWLSNQLHYRPRSATIAETMLRLHVLPQLGDIPLASVTRTDVQAAVAVWSSVLGPRTVQMAFMYVTAIFNHAVEDRLLQFSPCSRISLPAKQPVRVQPLTVDQVRLITERMPAWYRSMVTVGAATGLRSAELRGLTVDRVVDGVVRVDRQLVDATDGEVVFAPPKGGRERTVTMGDVAAKALTVHLDEFSPTDLVWRSERGAPLRASTAGKAWRTATAGLGVRDRSGWHDLRHFHASALIAAGMSVRLVADRLGHADPALTLRIYSHLWHDDDGRATAVMDGLLG